MQYRVILVKVKLPEYDPSSPNLQERIRLTSGFQQNLLYKDKTHTERLHCI